MSSGFFLARLRLDLTMEDHLITFRWTIKHQFTCVSNMTCFSFSCSLELSFFGNSFTCFHFFSFVKSVNVGITAIIEDE